jgi:2-polyprenyl-3-methyl-5-hydroxy-6-metoxy-1,4-benzoquinol methylase
MSNAQKTSTQSETVAQAFEQPEWYLRGYGPNIRLRCETVKTYSAERKFANILDVGCGDGSLSLPFLNEGSQVTFLDLSAAMLDIVAKRITPNLLPQAKFLKGDFTEVDLQPGSFDLVLFVGVLAYVSDIRLIARRLRQILRPGGMLITECTDAGHFIGRLNFGYRDLTALVRPGVCHTFRHKASEVIKSYEAEGLKLHSTFRYNYSLPLVSRLIKREQSYPSMRKRYGTAEQSRNQWLGSEVLMRFDVT